MLEVNSETDVGDFAIFRAKSKGRKVYANISDAIWLPDFQAKAGDLVIVYTKAGRRGEKVNKDGSTSNFVYWGEPTALWDDENFVPVLVEIATWDACYSPE